MQIEILNPGDASEMRYALEGIMILDLSQMWAVPGSGMYLADQGAEVIKVEPKWGDEGRRLMTASPIETEKGAVNRHFLPINRNKRSIVIDITTDEGSQDVSFSVTKKEAGSYIVVVDGLSASFHIAAPPVLPPKPAPPAPPAPTPTPEPTPEPVGPNWLLIGGIIAAVLVVALLSFFLVRRRSA